MGNPFKNGMAVVASHCIQCRGIEMPDDPPEDTVVTIEDILSNKAIALPAEEAVAAIITILHDGTSRVSCPHQYRDSDRNVVCNASKKTPGNFDAPCPYAEELDFVDELE